MARPALRVGRRPAGLRPLCRRDRRVEHGLVAENDGRLDEAGVRIEYLARSTGTIVADPRDDGDR
jgi:hypothetical protein